DIRRIEAIKVGDQSVGNRVRVKVVKNKVAPPFRQAEFDMYFGEGISRESGLLDIGVEAGILTKSGAWFLWGEERLGQGRDNARQYLREHPADADKIEATLRQKFFVTDPALAAAAKAPEGEDKADKNP